MSANLHLVVNPQTKTRTLSTAEERRETLIEAALPIFARRGFHAASTVEIAEAAGISQAYVFRLFPTKVDLFVAAASEGSRRMLATFREASDKARRDGTDQLEAMEQMVQATLELCDCEEELTGRTCVSLDLLAERDVQVRALDGSPWRGV